MEKETIKRLTGKNAKGFFKALQPGEAFTYDEEFYPKEIRLMAKAEGVDVEYCHPSTAEYKKYGDCTMTTIDEAPENAAARSRTAALDAAPKLLSYALNRTSVDSKIAWAALAAMEGRLEAALRAENERLGAPNFYSYYGADVEKLAGLAARVENLAGDESGAAAAHVVILAGERICRSMGMKPVIAHNFSHLLAAGIPGQLSNWYSDFRGVILKIDAIELSNRAPRIITTLRDGGGAGLKAYWFDGEPSMSFGSYEKALIFALYGKEHYNTTALLYDAANPKTENDGNN